MRDLVHRYLTQQLSRRGFFRRLTRWGYSAAAATSILESLNPLLEAEAFAATGAARTGGATIEGTGGELLVAQLRAGGVQFVFNCNSSATHPIFDALLDRADMHVIQVPHEGQAVAMAQGYTLGSGKIGFTINGNVGFPNTLNNMYNAWKDRTPMIVGSQREATSVQGGRDASAEWDDYLSPSARFTRWRWSIDRAERIPEITRRAFTIAATPPEGPVALAFPSDVLSARGAKAAIIERGRFMRTPTVKANPNLIEETARLVVDARHPVLLVGPEVTRYEAKREVLALTERLALPVAQGERLFDDFPTNHPLFFGDFHEGEHYPEPIDLIVNLGARMPVEDGVIPPHARVVHVSIDADAIGRVLPTELGIVANVREAAIDLLAAVESVATRERLATTAATRLAATRVFTDRIRAKRARGAAERWNSVPLSWDRMGAELNALLERDAIIVPELAELSWLEVAENAALGQLAFGPGEKTKIGRTTGSALGWGIGAAIGVKLAQPNRQVVALQGDGGFLFAQAELLWTMARHEVPVIVVIFNNRSYNGPRNKVLYSDGRQAKAGKEMTCYLGNPDVDFTRVAAGFGVAGELVSTPDQIRSAIQRAIASTREGKPYVIDALVARTGIGADSTWYPRYSVADARTRKV